MKHFTDRQPRRQEGKLCWTRKVSPVGFVEYRLFRRGETARKPHQKYAQFLPYAERRMIAADLRKLRKALRDMVDEIDLVRLEAA